MPLASRKDRIDGSYLKACSLSRTTGISQAQAPAMPLPDLNTMTGALLVGTWANSFLYMAEIMQARYYFTHFGHDDWQLKTFVSVAFLIDTLSTLGDYACVYLTSTGYINQRSVSGVELTATFQPIPLYLFTTGLVSVLVQTFLVVRYWWFTRNVIVTVLIGFLVVAALAGSFAVGVIITLFPAFTEREKVTIPATIWLATEAVADLSISAALLWEFRKAKSTLVEARSVLKRLVAVTIQTGTATSTLAVATLIAFLLKEESNLSVGIAYTLGRVYMLSMLANLNVRRTGRSAPDTTRNVSSAVGPTLSFTTMGTDDLYNSRASRSCVMQIVTRPADDRPPADTETTPQIKQLLYA
ncbi:hypothetical protein GGX14DRAFT_427807 [Mycena pura]|uniref:DUF6534 domain-containing protein n=1 Tax=Mycena pura TaxID=153505 RepID=A0AAD6YMC5_9AGAR|nr:hypothetical protein GGX14DRAFT_427807 [Mycena pura]